MPVPQYLLIDDLDALRRKLHNAQSPLDRYWQNYLELAAADPIGEYQALPMLAWLVTGEERFRPAIRSVLLELCEQLPLTDCSVEAQFHTYTAGAPIARFAVFLDWVWDSGILADDERSLLAGRMVDAVFSHCYLTLKGRLPSGDNQQSSMAFACAVTGYVFGVKRGRATAAVKMFREGCDRFLYLLESLFPGGWSGEGSTYHHTVVSPIMAIYCAFMEQVTGESYFDAKPAASSVRENLETAALTINTGGLLPGWDEYGNAAPELKTHLVYLARRTGDHRYLRLIDTHGLWSENNILAWYNDDKVWSLVFWPDHVHEQLSLPPQTWLNPVVCARMVSPGADLDVLQIWDIIGGGRPGRLHINPNNIEICAFGQVLTSDGRGKKPDAQYFDFDPEVMFSERDYEAFKSMIVFWQGQSGRAVDTESPAFQQQLQEAAESTAVGCGYSTLAAHSVVVVDDEGWRFPPTDNTGHGDSLTQLPSMRAVRGDVSNFYSLFYDIETMQRTTCVLGERLVLMHDRIAAGSPHRYTWQLMLRPDVTIAGNHARQRLREGTVLDVVGPDDSAFSLTEISGYPRVFEQRTQRLSFTRELTADGALPVLLRVAPGRRVVRDLSLDWCSGSGAAAVPATLFDAPATGDLSKDFIGPPINEPDRWFGKRVELSETEAAAAERLTIKRRQVDRLDVYVNGQQAPPSFEHELDTTQRKVQKCDSVGWESHFDVAGLLRPGSNELVIASSDFRGQSISGPILLLALVEPPATALRMTAHDGYLELNDGNADWQVALAAAADSRLALPNGAEATCLRLVAGPGTELCSAARQGRLGGLTFAATSPIDLEVSESAVHIDLLGALSARVTIDDNGDRLTILCREVVQVIGALSRPVFLRVGKAASVFAGDQFIAAPPAALSFIDLQRPLASAPSAPSAPVQYAAQTAPAAIGSLYEGGYQRASKDRDALLQTLHADEWREQVAAVEWAGEHGCLWAVPELIAIYEREEAAELYRNLNANWRFSKMLISFNGWADPEFPEPSRRRFRLKVVLLEALSRLNAREAEPLIRRALEAGTDFYPVLVQACLAAGRLGLQALVSLLEQQTTHFEVNTAKAALLALQCLRGEISSDELELLI